MVYLYYLRVSISLVFPAISWHGYSGVGRSRRGTRGSGLSCSTFMPLLYMWHLGAVGHALTDNFSKDTENHDQKNQTYNYIWLLNKFTTNAFKFSCMELSHFFSPVSVVVPSFLTLCIWAPSPIFSWLDLACVLETGRHEWFSKTI